MKFILFLILLPFAPILIVGALYIAAFCLIAYLPWVIASAVVEGIRDR